MIEKEEKIEDKFIRMLIEWELILANTKFPAFASTHEGWAVLKEEVEEQDLESKMMLTNIEIIWDNIKGGADMETIMDDIDCIREEAVRAIKEAIQVAAMCDKFKALAEPERVTVIDHYIKGQDEPERYVAPSLPGDPLNWVAKIVPSDTEPTCKEYQEIASDFANAVCSGLNHTERSNL